MGHLVGATSDLSYEVKTSILKASGIAVWDVLESCFRTTSSDSDIEDASLVVNDFGAFYREHPQISRVYFNGSKAAALYMRRVGPTTGPHLIEYVRLPSTSPAHASMSYDRKLAAWRAMLER
jgi:double-stranded uracil-DNA glycosylase